MSQPYSLPTGRIASVEVAGDGVMTAVEIDRESYLSYPIAPADLRDPKTQESLWELHQLVKRDGARLVFETYNARRPPPQIGEYLFCSWWIPDGIEAVRDLSAHWERLPYTGRGDCVWCPLTYDR